MIMIDKWQRDPTIKAVVQATFPKYRRTKVWVQVADHITFTDLNWSGGSRSEYHACSLNGEHLGSMARFNAVDPWYNRAEGTTVPIPEGVIVARGGTFAGKPAMLTLFVHPANAPRWLR